MSRCWLVMAVLLPGIVAASPPSPQVRRPVAPPDLPRYEIDARLDVRGRRVEAIERITFTNRSGVWVRELVLHVYPRYRVPDGDRLVLMKTLEMLRLSPEEAMDLDGRRLGVSACRVDDRDAAFTFDPRHDTLMTIPLADPLPPGASVTAEVAFVLDLPDKWGRWGQHAGTTYLVNWYPVLAHHDDRGWDHTPFAPWHQPWHQEAGSYDVRFEMDDDQVIASTGRIVGTERRGGKQVVTIQAHPARDFALVCSNRFEVIERRAGSTTVRVASFPEHRANAEDVLNYACEVIPLYENWFGPAPDDEFEIAPSFFGWNGNECSGLVLLDDRVMNMPRAGRRYLDHLVTHETCHQWWWNCVGTDGYAETFMDEGLVNAFTAMRLDAKYGRNAPLITWPRGLGWLPTIGREDLRLAGYHGWRARGGDGPVIQDLKEMGDLNSLFSLAYDRGGKVVEMIRNRLGEERFFAFFRHVYATYAWKMFHYDDLKRELAAFDPATDWAAFLDGWLEDHRETDWSVERVSGGKDVVVELRQRGEMVEPTVLLLRCGDQDLRVPIWPERGDYEVPGAQVRREGDRWTVHVEAPSTPSQVEVDPDHALLDARPDNNRLKPEVAWRFTPLVTPLDESPQFQAYDRVSVVAGPFIDQYTRGGLKVSMQRLDHWRLSAWAGVEPDHREAIFGGQASLLNWPWPSWTAGVFYEEGLNNFQGDRLHSGGRAFLRRRLLETSSVLLDDPGFVEMYLGTGNEFWPGDDGRPVDRSLTAIGGRYRMSTLFPYWDPVEGRLIELTAEHGDEAFGSSLDYARFTAEWGIVRPWPEGWGWLSRSRIALRAYGGLGVPDTSPYFRLGGGRRLRALDLADETGSSVWLATVEWRFPIWSEIDRDALDHVVGFRNLQGVAFYDVGETYLSGRWRPVVHGVGIGLRLDVSLFAFLERASFRLDVAQPIGGEWGPTVWVGMNQVF